MTTYKHTVTMNNGDTFNLFYVDKTLDWRKLANERWLPYQNGKRDIRYINIAQISDILIHEIDPIYERCP